MSARDEAVKVGAEAIFDASPVYNAETRGHMHAMTEHQRENEARRVLNAAHVAGLIVWADELEELNHPDSNETWYRKTIEETQDL